MISTDTSSWCHHPVISTDTSSWCHWGFNHNSSKRAIPKSCNESVTFVLEMFGRHSSVLDGIWLARCGTNVLICDLDRHIIMISSSCYLDRHILMISPWFRQTHHHVISLCNLWFPNEDLGRPYKRFGPCFQITFQWSVLDSVAQMEYSRMWKVLIKHGPKCFFSRPKSSFGDHKIVDCPQTRVTRPTPFNTARWDVL